MINLSLTNPYRKLGERFYHSINPTPVTKPGLIQFNQPLASELNIDTASATDTDIAALFAGNIIHESCEPLAMAYAGHQFGNFNPQLGDGRAIYLGEVEGLNGQRVDIQLKGSGQTNYSRGGDGRAALGPVLREYLLSEAMHQLKIPTTRALAAVTTGEEVYREQILPGGIITRSAASFIRVGSFQYFAMQQDTLSLKKLANYVIDKNYPDARQAENPYLAMFEMIVLKQASLIAKWMSVGFIHGVMNTDNMSVAGETIDYGPCAFMDFYKHTQVYSSIDHQGRYAYNNQPNIGIWNLSRMAEALLPLFSDDEELAIEMAKTALDKYVNGFANDWLKEYRKKCGMTSDAGIKPEDDKLLIESLLNLMDESHADFTNTFYCLSQLNNEPDEKDEALRDQFINRPAIDDWLVQWRKRLKAESSIDSERKLLMKNTNPVYIPRNHQVEAVIRAAEDNNDFTLFHQLHAVLSKPYEKQQGKDSFMQPPLESEIVEQTFCGT